MDKESDLYVALLATREAAGIHRHYFKQDLGVIDSKSSPSDRVSKVDLEADQKIKEIILSYFPEDKILSEEGEKERLSGRQWIVDPLDGTTNFVCGIPYFCVSIALKIDGVTETGVVIDSLSKEEFSAQKGLGGQLNGYALFKENSRPLDKTIGALHSLHSDRVHVAADVITTIRSYGAFALDLVRLAKGDIDCVLGQVTTPGVWDYAAGELIAQEAGVPPRETINDLYLMSREPLLSELRASCQELASG